MENGQRSLRWRELPPVAVGRFTGDGVGPHWFVPFGVVVPFPDAVAAQFATLRLANWQFALQI
jgi:hypothetical protein